jgi:hypothetical protein
MKNGNDQNEQGGEDHGLTEVDNFVANTIDDFLDEAKGDAEAGIEPMEPGPALIELAAVSLSEAVLRYSTEPKDVVALMQSRLWAILGEHLDRYEAAGKSHLHLIPRDD